MNLVPWWRTIAVRRATWAAAACFYIGAVAWLAKASALTYLLFPELGALAYDTFVRPRGTWASAPGMLVVTPTIAAILGTFVARQMDYGVVPVLTVVGLSIILIGIMRSPIAPAISAGLLPLALGEASWWYPPSVLFGTGSIAAVALLRGRAGAHQTAVVEPSDELDDLLEAPPRDYSWIGYFSVFLTMAAGLASALHWHFLLYPPLVVIAFEMFAHSTQCPWADRPLALPLACGTTATIGLLIDLSLGGGALAAGSSMLCGILVIRWLDLHAPPALAVGLLPFVIKDPDIWLPLGVVIGTSLLVLSFVHWRGKRQALTTENGQSR